MSKTTTKHLINPHQLLYCTRFGCLGKASWSWELLVAHGARVNDDCTAVDIPPFVFACACGDFEIIKWLVENGAWVNGQEVLEVTPLRKAIRQGSLQVVRLLISAGAKITPTKNPRDSVWCIAVLEGKSCILECLVESRLADLTEDNRVKASVLEYAAEKENMGILRYLLALKVFSRSDMNECLCTAAKLQNTEIVKLLMANGADVNESSKQEETPLFCAVQNSEAGVTEMLLVLGANVNMPASRNQYSAIHNMVIYRRLDSLTIVRQICGDVADFRAPSQRESNTPLQLATSGDDVDIVRFLLDVLSLDLEIDAENRKGETSLTLAIQKGYLGVVRLLVSKGAMINHQSSGWEPGALFTVVALGHFHVVQFLCENGADVSWQRGNGMSVMRVATRIGRADIVEYLAELHEPDFNALKEAVTKDRVDIVRILFAHNASAADPQDQASDLLHQVVMNDKNEIAQLLVRHGIDINRIDILISLLHQVLRHVQIPREGSEIERTLALLGCGLYIRAVRAQVLRELQVHTQLLVSEE